MPGREEEKSLPHILYSCYAQKSSEGEQFIPEHVLGYCISGSSEMYLGGKSYLFKAGEYRFFKKNQLSRYTKYPPPGGEYRSISIKMDQNTLHSISKELHLPIDHPYTGEGALLLKPNHLFKNYFDSLTPYLNATHDINKALTNLKVKEAIMILLETNLVLKEILFDFSEPGKIDLEAYMNKHYMFNVPTAQFAQLTGRSLASFKRDFEKVFQTSPGQWLQQKRLSEAHYLISQKGRKPSEVYLDVGFENLSHFSYSFKKAYGVAPSMI